jgi:hypothetical protein
VGQVGADGRVPEDLQGKGLRCASKSSSRAYMSPSRKGSMRRITVSETSSFPRTSTGPKRARGPREDVEEDLAVEGSGGDEDVAEDLGVGVPPVLEPPDHGVGGGLEGADVQPVPHPHRETLRHRRLGPTSSPSKSRVEMRTGLPLGDPEGDLQGGRGGRTITVSRWTCRNPWLR